MIRQSIALLTRGSSESTENALLVPKIEEAGGSIPLPTEWQNSTVSATNNQQSEDCNDRSECAEYRMVLPGTFESVPNHGDTGCCRL